MTTNDEVMTEVRRMARNAIKDELRRQGIKISGVEASDITKAVNHFIKLNPGLTAVASAEIRQREKLKYKVDISKLRRRKK